MVHVKYRMHQTAPMTGHVAEDGRVTFDPTALLLEARSYSLSGSVSPLSNCTFGPIPMALTGTADAGGLHLHADDTMIPPLPSNGCSGLAGFVNPRIAVSTDVAFDVSGDFRRFAPSTPVDVVTYFPSVAQYNQSYFVARVSSGTDIPTGDVTFRDGATVLGTAPVDATGHASLVASMDEPGTRTITAAYGGDSLHGPGSDTTTVEVSPAPTGLAIDGGLSVSGQPLGIGAGSQLVPATGTTGAAIRGDLASSRASLWFTPTTVPLDLPGYGPAQVEVRLFQYGQLSAATVGPEGSINGLNGMFVLQVRKVTTAAGTTIPLGCINLVLLGFDGRLTYTDVGLTTHAGGSGRIPLGICTGPGQAAIDQLAGGPVTATMHAPL
ncbi:MAG: Ig-like domain-containing protein [Acidimicrobiales bacterium]